MDDQPALCVRSVVDFFAADGLATLHVRSIVASLPWMAKLLCLCNQSWALLLQMAKVWLHNHLWMRGLRPQSLGLLHGAQIRGLHSKILGWSESILCA